MSKTGAFFQHTFLNIQCTLVQMYVFINCKYCSFETILFHLIDNGWKQKIMIHVQTMVYFKANKKIIHKVVLIKSANIHYH